MKKYIAELFGTFSLVFFGCGSAVIAGNYIGFLGIALTFGLTILAMVYLIGHISGCHINPAVTISMLVSKKIEGKDAGIYIFVQCLGALLASGILFIIASGAPGYDLSTTGLGQNGYGSASPAGYGMISAFIAELILTFLFLLMIYGATSKETPEGYAGLIIGFALAIIHLVGIPITGTSVNPARSLGPAVFVGGDALIQLWLFWVAPILGGLLAALLWKAVLEKSED
ncbi:MAG: aquaporin Z [Promethearchaeia archaeon]